MKFVKKCYSFFYQNPEGDPSDRFVVNCAIAFSYTKNWLNQRYGSAILTMSCMIIIFNNGNCLISFQMFKFDLKIVIVKMIVIFFLM